MRLSSPARLIVSLYRQHKDPATGWHREVYSRARCGLMPVYGLAPPARAGAPRYRDWRGRRAGGARAPNMPKRPARRSEAPSEAERGIGGADSGTIRTISPLHTACSRQLHPGSHHRWRQEHVTTVVSGRQTVAGCRWSRVGMHVRSGAGDSRRQDALGGSRP